MLKLARRPSDENGPGGVAFHLMQYTDDQVWPLMQDLGAAALACGTSIGGEPGVPSQYQVVVGDRSRFGALWVPAELADCFEAELIKRGHSVRR